jgi:hypothetical protein
MTILQFFGDTLLKEERNSRLRQLVRKLGHIRRTQKKQIDILCNDILAAHGEFIKNLKNFRFAADFYESILGINNPDLLAKTIGEFFTNNLNDVNAAIVFIVSGQPQIHIYATNPNLEDIPSQISPYLTTRMVQLVCQSGNICTADELCKMGFFAGPAVLKKISLAAIGLNKAGPALGMIILYRAAEKPLSNSELAQASSIVGGLSTALKNMQNSNATCDIYPPQA